MHIQPANFTEKDIKAHQDGQAPARRIGYLIAFVVILCGCLSLTGLWYVFNKDSVEILKTSWQLQSTGVTTTGTVAAVEQFSGVSPTSSSSFKLLVEYVVDGKTYTIQSNTFEERWGYAFLSVLP